MIRYATRIFFAFAAFVSTAVAEETCESGISGDGTRVHIRFYRPSQKAVKDSVNYYVFTIR